MNTAEQTTMIHGDTNLEINRKAAVYIGIMFILATVSAILGLLFYQPILAGPDYLVNGAAHHGQVILAALMELILVCTAIGTAIGMFPVLKPYGERIALSHLFFRFLVAVVITIGIVAILSLSTLSQTFVATNAADQVIDYTRKVNSCQSSLAMSRSTRRRYSSGLRFLSRLKCSTWTATHPSSPSTPSAGVSTHR